ncbi:MAG: hypothetical protein M3388_09350 [Acidobacteriota bacterium]|nr:hypothetical protein [Acidobacteriota bacterium]
MCGKALPFRKASTETRLCFPKRRHSREASCGIARKGRAFPHIGGHSPKAIFCGIYFEQNKGNKHIADKAKHRSIMNKIKLTPTRLFVASMIFTLAAFTVNIRA